MPTESPKKPVVLVVDDDGSVCDVLATLLSRERFQVETAPDGKDALAALDRCFVNVLLTDLHMPEMDGIELMRCVKARSPDTAVIVMTAYASAQSAIEAVRLGAFDYLEKPFSRLDDVVHMVKLALRHQAFALKNRDMVEKYEALVRSLKDGLAAAERALEPLLTGTGAPAATVAAEVQRILNEFKAKVTGP